MASHEVRAGEETCRAVDQRCESARLGQLALGASLTAVVTSNAKNYAIVITRTAGGVVAFNRSCTHQGSFVAPSGGNQLTCPSHGAVFNASTGAVIEGPASRALTQYKATERSGSIYVSF